MTLSVVVVVKSCCFQYEICRWLWWWCGIAIVVAAADIGVRFDRLLLKCGTAGGGRGGDRGGVDVLYLMPV